LRKLHSLVRATDVALAVEMSVTMLAASDTGSMETTHEYQSKSSAEKSERKLMYARRQNEAEVLCCHAQPCVASTWSGIIWYDNYEADSLLLDTEQADKYGECI
jgi:hypothetical protein